MERVFPPPRPFPLAKLRLSSLLFFPFMFSGNFPCASHHRPLLDRFFLLMEGSPRKLIWGVPSCFTMLSDLWITIAHLLIISMTLQVLTASAPATVEVGSDGEHMLTEDDPALLASPIEIGYFTTKTLQAAVRLWCMPPLSTMRCESMVLFLNGIRRVTNMFSLFMNSVQPEAPSMMTSWLASFGVQEMSYMFHKCIRFNQDLTRWMFTVTNMEGMFKVHQR